MSQAINCGMPPDINFEALLNSAAGSNDSRHVYLKDGAARTEGGFSHLFTTARTNANTVRLMQQQITRTCGENTGDMLSDRFAEYADGGKQMTVGVMRDIFKQAQMVRCNAAMRELAARLCSTATGNALGIHVSNALAKDAVISPELLKQGLADELESRFGGDPALWKNFHSDMLEPLLQLSSMPGGITRENVATLIEKNWGSTVCNRVMQGGPIRRQWRTA